MPGTHHVQVASRPDCSCDLLLAQLITPTDVARHPMGERTHLLEQRRQFRKMLSAPSAAGLASYASRM